MLVFLYTSVNLKRVHAYTIVILFAFYSLQLGKGPLKISTFKNITKISNMEKNVKQLEKIHQ